MTPRPLPRLALALLLLLTACLPGGTSPAETHQPAPPPPTSTPEISLTPIFTPSATEAAKPEASPVPSATPAPRHPTPSPSSDPADLAARIEQITTQSGGRWHIVIQPAGGEPLYTRDPQRRITIASVVKVPLAMLFFAALEQTGISDTELPAYLQSTGAGGRTFDQLLRAMLVRSEEKATAILEAYTRERLNVPAQQRAWGWEYLDLEARRYTAAGVAEIFEQLYRGEHISPAARALILGYLSAYTPSDDTRIGVLRGQLPPGGQIYNKRGSLLTPYVVADAAILENPSGTDYIIVIFAYNGEPKTTYERLDAAVAEIAQSFWDWSRQGGE